MALPARYGVTALTDVRSAPYSRFNPHFNHGPLAAAAKSMKVSAIGFTEKTARRLFGLLRLETAAPQCERAARRHTIMPGRTASTDHAGGIAP